ncbi:MAG: type 4a pilus biogenesis protein PilO [Actinomycetes bacterium]
MTGHRKRNNLIAGGVILAVASGATWLFILSPRLATAAELQTQTSTVEASITSQMRHLRELNTMVEDAPEAARRVQTLLSRMPQQAELPLLFTQITAVAKRSGISAQDVSAITPSVPVPIDSGKQGQGIVSDAQQSPERTRVQVAKLDLSITVTANADQLQRFLRGFEQLDRDFLVTGVNVAADPSDPSGDKQSATVTATTFVLQSQLPDLERNVRDLLAEVREVPAAVSATP